VGLGFEKQTGLHAFIVPAPGAVTSISPVSIFDRDYGDACRHAARAPTQAGSTSFPLFGVYAASKHALEAMSDALRFELEDQRIPVSIVKPGPVVTGEWWLGTHERSRGWEQHHMKAVGGRIVWSRTAAQRWLCFCASSVWSCRMCDAHAWSPTHTHTHTHTHTLTHARTHTHALTHTHTRTHAHTHARATAHARVIALCIHFQTCCLRHAMLRSPTTLHCAKTVIHLTSVSSRFIAVSQTSGAAGARAARSSKCPQKLSGCTAT
jgi:hypothetical protein